MRCNWGICELLQVKIGREGRIEFVAALAEGE